MGQSSIVLHRTKEKQTPWSILYLIYGFRKLSMTCDKIRKSEPAVNQYRRVLMLNWKTHKGNAALSVINKFLPRRRKTWWQDIKSNRLFYNRDVLTGHLAVLWSNNDKQGSFAKQLLICWTCLFIYLLYIFPLPRLVDEYRTYCIWPTLYWFDDALD